MTYETVIDVAQAGYQWSFPAFGLVMVVTGAALVRFPQAFAGLVGWSRASERLQRVFRWAFLGFAILWTLLAFGETFSLYRTARAALATGQFAVTEGPVTALTTNHKGEAFTVADRTFACPDALRGCP